MRAGGGRPVQATASVTRNGSDVGGNRGDTHYTHTDAYAHTRVCVQMHNSPLFPSASSTAIILLSPSLGPDHPPRAGLSNHISLYVILLSGAVSPFLPFLSSPLLSSFPLLRQSFHVSLSLPCSSLGYNVAASGVRGIIAGCVRSPRLCTAGAGTYYADVCNSLCASRIRPPPPLFLSLSPDSRRERTPNSIRSLRRIDAPLSHLSLSKSPIASRKIRLQRTLEEYSCTEIASFDFRTRILHQGNNYNVNR